MKKSSENKIYRVIGLMSGTAMDGIDAALIETDGYDVINRIGFTSIDHDPNLRGRLRAQLNKVNYDQDVERDFTLAQIPIVNKLINRFSLTSEDIDFIGFHGQTTHHDPDNGVTVQMGDGVLLASETGIDVVYDFRRGDVEAGGQGAPFLPIYHRALVQNAALNLPVVILNLGGVGNVTYIDHDQMVAFDTGPANAMIDDWIDQNTDLKYDVGGEIAAKGEIDQAAVESFLSHPYFQKPYPKSLDRNDFTVFKPSSQAKGCGDAVEESFSNNHDVSAHASALSGDNDIADGAATLTEFTVQSVAKGIDLCPKKPTAIYVTGGGRQNTYIMQRLATVTGLPIRSVDDLGWSGDAMEAEGFAYMAVRSVLNEPISFPGTTGCVEPSTGGECVKVKRNVA